MTNQDISTDIIQELIAASDHYAETLRTWQKTHLAWKNGEATIEEDRAADTARRAAFEKLKRLEAESGTSLREISETSKES